MKIEGIENMNMGEIVTHVEMSARAYNSIINCPGFQQIPWVDYKPEDFNLLRKTKGCGRKTWDELLYIIQQITTENPQTQEHSLLSRRIKDLEKIIKEQNQTIARWRAEILRLRAISTDITVGLISLSERMQ